LRETTMTEDQQLDTALAEKLGWKRINTFEYAPHVDGFGRDLPGPSPNTKIQGQDAWEGSEALFGYQLWVSRSYSCEGRSFFQPSRDVAQALLVGRILSGDERSAKDICAELLAK
jgi:hypothetical protein